MSKALVIAEKISLSEAQRLLNGETLPDRHYSFKNGPKEPSPLN